MISRDEVICLHHLQTGVNAMQMSGMQLELAAHLMLMAHSTGSVVILRAGNIANYDRPCAPKPGNIRSKSSRHQGFYNGYIAAEHDFTRLEPDAHGHLILRGIHPNDQHRLQKPITATDHIHTVQIKVTLQDIVNQLSPTGDLLIKSFDTQAKKLELQFKAGKGLDKENIHFLIDFNQANKFTPKFSRPWNASLDKRKIAQQLSQLLKDYLGKDSDYFVNYIDQEFPLFFIEDKACKPAKVFARTPQSLVELKNLLQAQNPQKLKLLANTTFKQALEILGEEQLEKLYSKYALPITGDWDGLAIGHPIKIPIKYLKTYNTFLADKRNQVEDLLNDTHNLLSFYRSLAKKKSLSLRTAFDDFVQKIDIQRDLCNDFDTVRAGIITPYEFLFQELVNHSYNHKTNQTFGEKILLLGLQETVNYIIEYALHKNAPWNSCQPKRNPNALEIDGLITAAKIKLTKIRKNNILYHFSKMVKQKSEMHLENTLRTILSEENFMALKNNSAKQAYVDQQLVKITHPDADLNIQNPFQHGVDMRSPYAPECDAPWLLITHDGMVVRGENHSQLIAVLLSDDAKLLQCCYFDVHPQINMCRDLHNKMGWVDVVEKQLLIDKRLGLNRVPLDTIKSYNIALNIENLEKKYAENSLPLTAEDQKLLTQIIACQPIHKQNISCQLLAKYAQIADLTESPEQTKKLLRIA